MMFRIINNGSGTKEITRVTKFANNAPVPSLLRAGVRRF